MTTPEDVFRNTMPAPAPAPGPQPADWLPLTAAEQAAFTAGREYQAPISVREGAAMGRITWFCWGVMLTCVVLGPLKCSGVVQ